MGVLYGHIMGTFCCIEWAQNGLVSTNLENLNKFWKYYYFVHSCLEYIILFIILNKEKQTYSEGIMSQTVINVHQVFKYFQWFFQQW